MHIPGRMEPAEVRENLSWCHWGFGSVLEQPAEMPSSETCELSELSETKWPWLSDGTEGAPGATQCSPNISLA